MAIDACVRLPTENQCTEHTGTSAPLKMNDELDISHDSLSLRAHISETGFLGCRGLS
jgi:hypothetical protein